ncbi:MAG: gliding motility-associated C-terminal domain-containing protein [Flavobacteriia bacterium]
MRKNLLLSFFIIFLSEWSIGQTLIINEVSNGPAGNQEYVEFVVVSDAVTYDCNASTPPCIDIRGWIFDDNSGYHSVGQGVAPGAVRFANIPFWSCLPLGTIIVIYNNAETNTSISGPDVSMADGNCRLIVPLNDPAYFEFNAITPGDIACSYPAVGWGTDSSPTWIGNTALANSGDCARIVDLSGCEVFSVCYASADSNNLIYFASGGSGADNVWYFNNGNPNDQSNWSEGCADPGTCGSNVQTPGLPNNLANGAYIAQFNNGCSPITPVAGNTMVDNHEQCGCDGQATASGSGSIGPYTYEWFNAALTPIGQTTATATGLCPGNYFVTVTSSIDCDITVSVTINPGAPVPSFTTSFTDPTSCGGSNGTITLSGLNPSTGYELSYSDDGSLVGPAAITTTAAGTYVISGLNAGVYSVITISNGICNSLPASVSLSDPAAPVFSVSQLTNPSTCGGTDGAIHIEGTGTLLPTTVYSLSYSDNGTIVGPVNITTDANGDYNITGLDAGSYSSFTLNYTGCIGSQPGPINLIDPTPPTATATTTTPVICDGSSIVLSGNTVTGGTYSWTGPNSFTSNFEDPVITAVTTLESGTYTLTITLNNCVSLPSSVNITVNATPVLTISDPLPVCSPNTVNISSAAVTAGSTNAVTISYWVDGTASNPLLNPSAIAIGGTYYILAENVGCSDFEPVTVTINAAPVITDLADQTVCDTYTLPAINLTGTATTQGYYTTSGGGGTQLTVGSAVTGTQTIYIYAVNGTCSDEETVLITVNNTPLIDPLTDASACGTYFLPVITGTNLNNEGFYNNSQALGGTVITGPITTSQTVWVYDEEGICNDETSFVVTINPLPEVTDFSGGNSYCTGDVVTNVEVAVTGTNDWTIDYTLDGVSQTATGTSSPVSLGNLPGVYVITNVTDANCANTGSGTQTIVINPIPSAPLAGTDAVYCSSWDLVNMTVSGTGGTYTWYSDEQLSLVLGTGTGMMPIEVNGTNSYYVTETVNGCEGPASIVSITIEDCEIVVPTAITPNGDGIHDTWEIVNLDVVYPDNVVTVYNRWGNMIYQSEKGQYSVKPWDGTYEGDMLPVASYYFVIDLNDSEKGSQTGIVSIVLEK